MPQNIHIARRQVAVHNVLGLHLRAADKFVRLANAFQSEVRVHCKGVMANGKIYRARLRNDALTPFAGGRGTWVDTGLTIPDVSTVADL